MLAEGHWDQEQVLLVQALLVQALRLQLGLAGLLVELMMRYQPMAQPLLCYLPSGRLL